MDRPRCLEPATGLGRSRDSVPNRGCATRSDFPSRRRRICSKRVYHRKSMVRNCLWCSHGRWWINRSPSTNPFRAGFFVIGQSGQATSSWREAPCECCCRPFHPSACDMARHPQQAFLALKREPVAMGTRALRAPSTVGWFCWLPELSSGAESVAPNVCLLALVAAREPRAASGEDAQNGSTRATIPDCPAAVRNAEPLPRSGMRALPPHDGPTDSRVQEKPCSTSQRSPSPVSRRGSASPCPEPHHVCHAHEPAPPVAFFHLAVDRICRQLPPTHVPPSPTQPWLILVFGEPLKTTDLPAMLL